MWGSRRSSASSPARWRFWPTPVHNASDVLSLLVAWGATILARRPPSGRYTYGFRRSPILASLFNALLLLLAMGGIIWEAVGRFGQPTELSGSTVFWVAAVGLAVNTGTALLFASGKDDLNIRGAYLHLLADAGVTLGVMVAGLGIAFTGAAWLDPVVSLAIAGAVLWSTWGLLRGALEFSLDAAPEGVDLDGIRRYLNALPGVRSVHDLHVAPKHHSDSADRAPRDAAGCRRARPSAPKDVSGASRPFRGRTHDAATRDRRPRAPLYPRSAGCGLEHLSI
jgi:cobalt-zinc-cadmium efflux system protein